MLVVGLTDEYGDFECESTIRIYYGPFECKRFRVAGARTRPMVELVCQ